MTGKDIAKITFNLVIIYVVGGLLLAGVYAKTSPVIFVKNKQEKEAALKKMMPVHLKFKVPEAAAEKALKHVPEQYEAVRTDAGGGVVAVDVVHDMYEKETASLMKALKKAGATEIEEASTGEIKKEGDWEPLHHHASYYQASEGGVPLGYIIETYGKGYSSYINIMVAVDPSFTVKKINVLSHAETPGLGDEIERAWFKDQYKGKDAAHLEVIKGETPDKIQAITGATISTRAVTNGVRDGVEMLMKKYTGAGAEGAAGGEAGEEEKEAEHGG